MFYVMILPPRTCDRFVTKGAASHALTTEQKNTYRVFTPSELIQLPAVLRKILLAAG